MIGQDGMNLGTGSSGFYTMERRELDDGEVMGEGIGITFGIHFLTWYQAPAVLCCVLISLAHLEALT